MRFIKLSLVAVLALGLLATPALAAHGKGHYKTNVHVQMAPGYKGPIHVGDPLIVSIRGRGHGGERYDLCLTPGPIQHAACFTHRRVNGPGVSTEPSKTGKLRLHWKLSTGHVITRTLRIVK